MTNHAIKFDDLACLCDWYAQCRGCSGRARSLPSGFDRIDLHVISLEIIERDPGDYTGQHRRP